MRELEHDELSGGHLKECHGFENPMKRAAVSGTEGQGGNGETVVRKDGQGLRQGEISDTS